MQPAARIAAAIEILDDIETSILNGGVPADRSVAQYLRGRRYIGSKDRRAITGYVYAVLRCRGQLLWLLRQASGAETPRNQVLAYCALYEPESLSLFGDEGAHAPTALTDVEKGLTKAVCTVSGNMPDAALLEMPDVIKTAFTERFGDALPEAMMALNAGAPVGMRINSLRVDAQFIEKFKKDYQDIEYNEYSPIGFSSKNNLPLQNIAAYRDGLIEVQDEAAQLASFLVDARPGMHVVDLCAGAGGKSLTLAATMNNQGRIDAFDVGANRLRNLDERTKRADASIIKSHVIPHEGAKRSAEFDKLASKADRVLVDAPCSGTGTWRRNPDQRWRLSENQIKSYAALQLKLLEEGADLAAPGGRLIYMTCSLLSQENEAVVKEFMQVGEWRLVPWQDLWVSTLKGRPTPASLSPLEGCLQLAPHLHNTDGFFLAVFER